MNNKKKSAFTLAETIMTLFIVGLVITAAIPAFTVKQHQAASEVNFPWKTCTTGGQTEMDYALMTMLTALLSEGKIRKLTMH